VTSKFNIDNKDLTLSVLHCCPLCCAWYWYQRYRKI